MDASSPRQNRDENTRRTTFWIYTFSGLHSEIGSWWGQYVNGNRIPQSVSVDVDGVDGVGQGREAGGETGGETVDTSRCGRDEYHQGAEKHGEKTRQGVAVLVPTHRRCLRR
jgi:hypothetical protein